MRTPHLSSRNLPALGEAVTRVWRLNTGGMLTIRYGRMGVDQLLCVRPGEDHTLPAVRSGLLEKTMSQRPGWDGYAARVPLFVPRPPRL